MNELYNKKIKSTLIFFWSLVWIFFSLLLLKIYYTNIVNSSSMITHIESAIGGFSAFYDLVILTCSILIIIFLIELKIKKEKIFQNKKVIFKTFFLSLLIIVVIFIINIMSERTIMIEGDPPGRDIEVPIFNNKFIAYVGKNTSQSKVKALINVIISNNFSNSHTVKVIFNNKIYETKDDFAELINEISNIENFNCSHEYDSDGFIDKIIIEEIIK